MKIKKHIYWDLRLDPVEYPKIIKNIYFKINLDNRNLFVNWIDKISKKGQKDLDWWVSLPPSRHPYMSKIHHKICVLETLKKISNQKYSINIILSEKNLLNIIFNWSKNNKKDIKLIYKKEEDKFNKYFIFLKAIFFSFFIFLYIKFFIKKVEINKKIKNNILIDTFASNESVKKEKLYFGLDDFLKRKKILNVFFVPTFIVESNLLNTINIINLHNERKCLFKEHYLSFKDLLFSWGHVLRVKKYVKKYERFKNWDLSSILSEELLSLNQYNSTISGILNFRFAKNLYNQNIKINKYVNWFENQIIDKGWNLGFRQFYPNCSSLGYQGFLYHGQYINLNPSKFEKVAKVIPETIINPGKSYVKLRKEFCKSLKVQVGPALRFQDIFKDYNKKKSIEILLILSGIKYIDLKLIGLTTYFLKKNKDIKLVIKTHPILPKTKIKDRNIDLLKNQIIFSDEKLSTLLKKTKISICSGPTSGTIESIAYNCFLIIPVMEPYDELNLKLLKIPKKSYSVVYNKNELLIELKKNLANNKNNYIKKRLISKLFENTTDKKLYMFVK